MQVSSRVLAIFAVLFLSSALISCASSNPNSFRVLTAITVTPSSADASTYPNGQVTFAATGQFNLPPLSGPVTFTPPYSGEFIVDNPSNQTVANITSTGNGTVTVQCVDGVSASVDVVATASANNLTGTIVNAQGQLICP